MIRDNITVISYDKVYSQEKLSPQTEGSRSNVMYNEWNLMVGTYGWNFWLGLTVGTKWLELMVGTDRLELTGWNLWLELNDWN